MGAATERLDFARQRVAKVAQEMGRMFVLSQEDLQIEMKRDGTPRTLIDLRIGEFLRGEVLGMYPNDSINEEETGISGGVSSDWGWQIDPLDGTSNVEPQFPLCVVGMTVTYKGQFAAAAVGNPFEQAVTWGEIGNGAFVEGLDGSNRQQIFVASASFKAARYAEVDTLFNEKTTARKLAMLAGVSECIPNIRMFGSNILAGSHLAQGRIHAVLTDCVSGPFDIGPTCVLGMAAGGRVSNLQGEFPKPGDQLVLATNSQNHGELLAALQRCYAGYEGFR